MAEGLRREGGRRRERLACTVFLASGGMERENVDGSASADRAADEDRACNARARGGFELGGQCTGTQGKKEEGTEDGAVDGGTGDDDADREWWW